MCVVVVVVIMWSVLCYVVVLARVRKLLLYYE